MWVRMLLDSWLRVHGEATFFISIRKTKAKASRA